MNQQQNGQRQKGPQQNGLHQSGSAIKSCTPDQWRSLGRLPCTLGQETFLAPTLRQQKLHILKWKIGAKTAEAKPEYLM